MSQTPALTASSAVDAPVLVVTATVQKNAQKKKKVLNAEEAELFELTQAAGVTMDQEVFKIIADLLKMNVAPQAVFQTLKSMCASQRVAEGGATDAPPASHSTPPTTTSTTTSSTSNTSNTTTAVPAEGRAVVRCKPSASLSEKPRETSVQRLQRQPSATRGTKTKSSGSSSLKPST